MKKGTILILTTLLLCGALAACGTMGKDDRSTTSTTRGTTELREQQDVQTTDRDMGELMRENAETVSEMFSEGASELRDSSFLDPRNGMISDTQPND